MEKIIRLKILPGAKKNVVVKMSDDQYEVSIKAPPLRNAANELLLKVLAEYFDIPTTSFSILSGHHSRHKRIKIK